MHATLFDDVEDDSVDEETAGESDWQEVPQALFLSWSERRQLAYCAARDEDSAAGAATLEELNWYRERANAYKADIANKEQR